MVVFACEDFAVVFTLAGKSVVRTSETLVVNFIIEETVSKRGEIGSVAFLASVASVELSTLPKFREMPSVAFLIVEDTVAVFAEVVVLLVSVEVDLTKGSKVLAVVVPGSTVDLVTLVVCVISSSIKVPLLKIILVVLDSSDANSSAVRTAPTLLVDAAVELKYTLLVADLLMA